jgi:isopenicillin N synthase-like dioxygenase
LASYIALGLGKDRDFFTPWFEKDSLSTFRTIYYKPRSQATVKQDLLESDEFKLVTPEHSDSGFLTLLTTFGYPGL